MHLYQGLPTISQLLNIIVAVMMIVCNARRFKRAVVALVKVRTKGRCRVIITFWCS